jgi:hypothetical protein
MFTADAKKVPLSDFHFRPNEPFLYEYDFGDLWQYQVRFECPQLVEAKRTYPVCIGGSRAAPPEDCSGPWTSTIGLKRRWRSFSSLPSS